MGFMHSCTFAIVHNCSLHTCANQVIALQSIRGMDIDLHADLLRAVKQGEGTCGAVHFCRRYYNGRVFTQYTIRHICYGALKA